jgi:hypothetical protein
MRAMENRTRLILLVFIVSFLLTTGVTAASSYTLDWWTVDAGGGTSQSTGGDYTLRGTIGQWEAGELNGGVYALLGGFWVRRILAIWDFVMHLPLVFR